jgi:transposase
MKENSKVAKSESANKQIVKSNASQVTPKTPSDLRAVAKRLRLNQQFQGDDAMTRSAVTFFVGIDLGDKKSNYCILNKSGGIVEEGFLPTSQAGFEALLKSIPKCRIGMEVGTHSPWINALLESYGHHVLVANPRKMESIHKNRRKNDKVDARILARLVRADPELLYPIHHRGVEARRDLVFLRARHTLVKARTKLINSVRGLTKSMGGRIPKCSGECFHSKAAEHLPDNIRPALEPLVAQIEAITLQIRKFDYQIKKLAAKLYPETATLTQVNGVGPVTSLAYVLTVENPERFAKSRDVGPYLGLIPQQDDSGDTSKQLRITKTGDRMLRQLLVHSAQYILGPFGEDCNLRRFGLKLAARGGKNAKKRAVVAVARKLAVMLHRLWTTGEVYEPLRNSEALV